MTLIAQIRAARSLLGWSQTSLAAASGLSLPTIKRFETASGARVSQGAIEKMRSALEAAGVDFIDQDVLGGPGVRLNLWYAEMANSASKGGLSQPYIVSSTNSVVRLVSTDSEHQINIDIDALALDEYFERQLTHKDRWSIVANNLPQFTDIILSKYVSKGYSVTSLRGVRCINIAITGGDMSDSDLQLPCDEQFFPDDFPIAE